VKKVDLDGASSLGNYIEVEHVIEGQHVTSLYAHLDPSTIKVEEGDEVQVGDELAGVGNTGISTGPHLHLEIHVNGDYVDPITFLQKVNVAGVETSMPTELTATVGLGSDTKLESADSTALIEELFVSKINN
jgi:murein DD-endopeptidase MepM/ murein hydrolase activator NlpD